MVGQEGEGGGDQSAAAPHDIGEVDTRPANLVAVREDAGHGLRELFAVMWVVDEVQPVAGDALEAAERFGGYAREYLDEEVVGESLGRNHAAVRRGRPAQTRMEKRSGWFEG